MDATEHTTTLILDEAQAEAEKIDRLTTEMLDIHDLDLYTLRRAGYVLTIEMESGMKYVVLSKQVDRAAIGKCGDLGL